MARLEIPSIVVHKGSRSQSRPESPTGVVCGGGMPSLPSSKQSLVVGTSVSFSSTGSDMIDGNANPSNGFSSNPQNRSATPEKPDADKTYRNRANSKVKLLVRSHAMRESTSPPREPHNGGSSPNSLSPNSNPSSKQLNNNEPMFNSNLCPAQNTKQMRNSTTSPTCRTPSRNGPSSPSQAHSPKNVVSPTNGKENQSHRTKSNNANGSSKCNNCVKNNQNERPGLLQTPVSPLKTGQTTQYSQKGGNQAQNNQHKSEQRRPNTLNVCNNQCSAQCGNILSASRPGSRHKLRYQNSSSQGSYESASPSLSRDSSTELYTDSTGIDLEQFIAETINRNQKDRTVLLKIEKDLIEFAKDRQKVCHKFPNMSSYNRMLVHRVAAYFGMEHNVDQSGLSVIVTRTKNMRIPETRFKQHIRDDLILTEEPRRSILKRDSSSFEDSFNFKSPDRLSDEYCRRSKSFEEREEEYERARRRIFKDSNGESSEVVSWPYWSSSESSDASARYRLLHPSDHTMRQARLAKGESCDGRETFRGGVPRPSVSKSFSFGGYTRGMLSRGDSVVSTHSAGARLTKQDSGASMSSRLSPSSSGYKSQSQRSDATISPSPSPSPVPPLGCGHTQISSQDSVSPEPNGQTVVWAVSSMSSVPPGSFIIDPQTNEPFTNPDGTIYRFDPKNPPKLFPEESEPRPKSQEVAELRNSAKEKRRFQKNAGNSAANQAQVTNSATSPSLPLPSPPPPPPLPPQQSSAPQTLVKTTTMQACGQNQVVQPYATYLPTSEPYSQSVYQVSSAQQTVMMAPHLTQGPPAVQNSGQGDVIFNQNPLYANYAVPVQQGHVPQPDASDLSGYFMGMNMYDQRGGGDSRSTPPHPHSYQPPPPSSNQTLQSVQSVQPNFWQSPNQLPPQPMYFVPSPGTISMNQNSVERVQPRFGTSYSFNLQTMTPPSQSTSNYVSNYSVPYNSMPALNPTQSEFSCQPPIHVVPAYYPQPQPGMQPPVMYRVPTPPNTPTSTQLPGVPLMYMNSGSYAPPGTMVSAGTFGHQLGPSGASPAPPGAYMSPALVPNLVFRQNVPLVAGVRPSTPGSSQRTSRSPTPAHEFFGGGDRNAQPQSRYSLPVYQGFHIVQGDIRLMHPGMQGNPRLQYAQIPSPPVVQGCPRPYRPPSYSSNVSGAGTPNSFDGRNQKIRKQRSKIATLPSTCVRPNLYQNLPMSSLSCNAPKDIRDGTVKVTITRRNPLIQY